MGKNTCKKAFFAVAVAVFAAVFMIKDTAESVEPLLFEPANTGKLRVTADHLNVRTGPGTGFLAFTSLKQGDTADTIGQLGDFYVIRLPDDSVGVVSKTYVKAEENDAVTENSDGQTEEESGETAINGDVKTLLTLINRERTANGLAAYRLDKGLCALAEMKAADLIENQYFAHDSPRYGSPFEMLKSYGVVYKSAGENIAANKTPKGAHTQLMNSPYHRINLLNTGFDRIGVAVTEHPAYGKLIVQIFTEQE